jgi:AcrR family transcriptional regulator
MTRPAQPAGPEPDPADQGASPAPVISAAKARLLDATIDYVCEHGVADLTLRRLADALGTSHRMLIYHFGSKDGLLLEVVHTVEARQRQALSDLGAMSIDHPDQLVRRLWARLADPAMWPLERLFFELYGQALQGHPVVAPLLDGIVESWLGPATELGLQMGLTRREARDQARLGLAVTRGLLLDLLATGDRRGVDRAMNRYLASLPSLGVTGVSH